jgi:predicted MPP superfamily phosphohydrolase
MSTARILHISDLHARREIESDEHLIVGALLSDIALQHSERPFDLVVFSGDLAHDGTEGAFNNARAALLDPLRATLPGCEIVLTPGNHDVDRDRMSPVIEAGLVHTLKDRESLRAFQEDREGLLSSALARLSDWSAFEKSWYADGTRRDLHEHFSWIHEVEAGSSTAGVAVLNSAWRGGSENDRGRILIGDSIAREALDAIDQHEIRLIVVHHPLTWLADYDAAALREMFESCGVFVLTGHEHAADPATEITTRGAALYSRAGCLYAGSTYANGYTILDLDIASHSVDVSLRRWWPPPRSAFDEATDLHRDGSFTLPWPVRRASSMPVRATFKETLAPLAQLAQERSLIGADLSIDASATVADLLVEPRFWPVPNREAVEKSLDREQRPQPVDVIEAAHRARVIIVSGDQSAGVTSSLLWVLEQHFRKFGTAYPAYVEADRRFSLGRLRQAVVQACGGSDEQSLGETPIILAVDDVHMSDRDARTRLARFLADYPSVTLLIGCHDEAHADVARVLESVGIQFDRVFLAPFGRRELRQLVVRIAGPDSSELVSRVLSVIHGQGLARNPLNVAALVAVVTRQEDLTELNESGLLQAYVNILLENPVATDPEGLGLDYRRREYFLAQFASHLVELNRPRLPRSDTERFVLAFYDSIGVHFSSAAQLIESLIRRRVLSENSAGVGFRYPALLHLFAAKRAAESADFAARILEDPVRFGPLIRHMAGLQRSDKEMLVTVCAVARRVVDATAPGLDVSQFELIRDEDGWSQITDLSQVRQLVRPSAPPPTEDELDDIYEDLPDSPTPIETLEVFPSPDSASLDVLGQLGPPIELLAAVLKSSELVPDVTLKSDVLRQVIEHWSLLTILIAVQEDETGDLKKILEAWFSDERDEARRTRVVEHVSRVLVLTVSTFALYANAGSRHLAVVLEGLLDDDAFMAKTPHALFATMLFAMLGLPGWPKRLSKLHERHPNHPMVGEVARRWALYRYNGGGLELAVQTSLEGVLVDMLMPTGTPKSGPERVGRANEIRARLQAARRREVWRSETPDSASDGE